MARYTFSSLSEMPQEPPRTALSETDGWKWTGSGKIAQQVDFIALPCCSINQRGMINLFVKKLSMKRTTMPVQASSFLGQMDQKDEIKLSRLGRRFS